MRKPPENPSDLREAIIGLGKESRRKSYYPELQAKVEELEREIATRKKAEENLRITLYSIGDAVISSDADGRIARLNPVAEKLTGWNAEEAIGRPLGEVFCLVAATSSPPIFGDPDSEAVLRTRDGHEHLVSGKSSPILSPIGEVVGHVLVFRDITSSRRMEESVRQSQKMEAVGKLASGIAHDFNNILAGIVGNIQLLGLQFPPDNFVQDTIREILSCCNKAADLNRQLLTFSRKKPAKSQPFDLHGTIRDSVVLVKRSIDPRIDLSVDLQAEKSIVLGDPALIQCAIMNLLINARDAMPTGGKLTLMTAVSALDEEFCRSSGFSLDPGLFLRLDVRDSGQGMSGATLANVFEPFFTTKEEGKGTGLGLSVVYNAMVSHHGFVTVASAPGAGTTFSLYFPLGHGRVPEPAPSSALVGRRRSGRLLLIDDDLLVRSALTRLLETQGYEIVEAGDGEEGVRRFAEGPASFRAVILDMVMPRMNGPDCFFHLKEIDPEVCVIVSSGFHESQDIQEIMENGGKAVLQKPYHLSDILQALDKALSEP